MPGHHTAYHDQLVDRTFNDLLCLNRHDPTAILELASDFESAARIAAAKTAKTRGLASKSVESNAQPDPMDDVRNGADYIALDDPRFAADWPDPPDPQLTTEYRSRSAEGDRARAMPTGSQWGTWHRILANSNQFGVTTPGGRVRHSLQLGDTAPLKRMARGSLSYWPRSEPSRQTQADSRPLLGQAETARPTNDDDVASPVTGRCETVVSTPEPAYVIDLTGSDIEDADLEDTQLEDEVPIDENAGREHEAAIDEKLDVWFSYDADPKELTELVRSGRRGEKLELFNKYEQWFVRERQELCGSKSRPSNRSIKNLRNRHPAMMAYLDREPSPVILPTSPPSHMTRDGIELGTDRDHDSQQDARNAMSGPIGINQGFSTGKAGRKLIKAYFDTLSYYELCHLLLELTNDNSTEKYRSLVITQIQLLNAGSDKSTRKTKTKVGVLKQQKPMKVEKAKRVKKARADQPRHSARIINFLETELIVITGPEGGSHPMILRSKGYRGSEAKSISTGAQEDATTSPATAEQAAQASEVQSPQAPTTGDGSKEASSCTGEYDLSMPTVLNAKYNTKSNDVAGRRASTASNSSEDTLIGWLNAKYA